MRFFLSQVNGIQGDTEYTRTRDHVSVCDVFGTLNTRQTEVPDADTDTEPVWRLLQTTNTNRLAQRRYAGLIDLAPQTRAGKRSNSRREGRGLRYRGQPSIAHIYGPPSHPRMGTVLIGRRSRKRRGDEGPVSSQPSQVLQK